MVSAAILLSAQRSCKLHLRKRTRTEIGPSFKLSLSVGPRGWYALLADALLCSRADVRLPFADNNRSHFFSCGQAGLLLLLRLHRQTGCQASFLENHCYSRPPSCILSLLALRRASSGVVVSIPKSRYSVLAVRKPVAKQRSRLFDWHAGNGTRKAVHAIACTTLAGRTAWCPSEPTGLPITTYLLLIAFASKCFSFLQ